jgi:hypothetical protein
MMSANTPANRRASDNIGKMRRTCPGHATQPPHELVNSLANFSPNKSRNDGLAVYCRRCAAARAAVWRAKNQEKVKQQRKVYYAKTGL